MKIVPSLIANDQKTLVQEFEKVNSVSKTFQLDIMDKEFVPNESLLFDWEILNRDNYTLQAHLMVSHPESWIEQNSHKVDYIIPHFETLSNPQQMIDLIKEKNKFCGFALKLETPISAIKPFLSQLDIVILLGVEPGQYGAPYHHEVVRKIQELQAANDVVIIQIDGGVSPQTVSELHVQEVVVGSYLQQAPDIIEAVKKLKEANNEIN